MGRELLEQIKSLHEYLCVGRSKRPGRSMADEVPHYLLGSFWHNHSCHQNSRQDPRMQTSEAAYSKQMVYLHYIYNSEQMYMGPS